MDTKILKLIEIFQSISYDAKTQCLKELFYHHSRRFYNILWGPGAPLEDGYQMHDWVSISILTTNWFIEVLADSKMDDLINYLDANPHVIADILLQILYHIVDKNLVVLPDNSKHIALMFLSSQVLIPTIIDTYIVLSSILHNCHCCGKSKKIKRKIQEKTHYQIKEATRHTKMLN
jgi:hypothetical protein